MNIFINILVAVICLVFGYLMGSTNISIPIGKIIFKQDPRDYASKNCGATNCGRIWGKKYFFIVFFFDVFKTIAPLYICWAVLTFAPMNNGMPLLPSAYEMHTADISSYVIQWPVYWLASVGSLFGSVYPLFTGFRGGKAASNMIGLALATNWALSVTSIVTFLTTLFKTKYVSLSSIMTGVVNFVFVWILSALITFRVIPDNLIFLFQWGPLLYCNYVYAIVMSVEIIVMIARHHENIKRLLAGNERKVSWIKSKK